MLLNSFVLVAKNRPALGAILQQTSSHGKESAKVGHPQQREWVEGRLQEKVGQTRRVPVDLRLVREDEVDVRIFDKMPREQPQGHRVDDTVFVDEDQVVACCFLDRDVFRMARPRGSSRVIRVIRESRADQPARDPDARATRLPSSTRTRFQSWYDRQRQDRISSRRCLRHRRRGVPPAARTRA